MVVRYANPFIPKNVLPLLKEIEPDQHFEQIDTIEQLIFDVSEGSADGRNATQHWMEPCADKYPEYDSLEERWSRRSISSTPKEALGQLSKLATGATPTRAPVPPFSDPKGESARGDTEVDDSAPDTDGGGGHDENKTTCLDRYAVSAHLADIESLKLDPIFVLWALGLLRQFTVIYAQYNAGKTLIVIWLLAESVRAGRINGARVYYLNADDSFDGLVAKHEFLNALGINMLSPGYGDFRTSNLVPLLREMISDGTASGSVLILDTVKKFIDHLDKGAQRLFYSVVREFVLAGGTVIALSHVNKRRGPNGKPIYAGTTDLIDDSDCAWVVDIAEESETHRIVEFENKKSRGQVDRTARFRYSLEPNQSYAQLVESVERVSDEDTGGTDATTSTRSRVIVAISGKIQAGINTKMRLAQEVSLELGVSKREVVRILESESGDDPYEHHWTMRRGERGAHIYTLHNEDLETNHE